MKKPSILERSLNRLATEAVEQSCKKCKCSFVYPRSTKEFIKTRSGMSVHSMIELEFGNVGFLGEGKTGVPEKTSRSRQLFYRTYHGAICYSLRFQLSFRCLLKAILIRPVWGHHTVQTTTPWGKSFFLQLRSR